METWFDQWLRDRTGRLYHAVDFAFDGPLNTWAVIVVLALLFAGVWVWSTRDHVTNGGTGRARTLAALRASALTLLVFAALGPTLVGYRSDPATRHALLLFDDSVSMAARDARGAGAGDRLIEALAQDDRRFERLLAGAHTPAYFRFGRAVERLRTPSALRFDQTETNILDAVRGAVAASASRGVSAVVLFSDGVQQPKPGRIAADPQIEVPVFTVGVGPETRPPFLAVARLSVTRTNFDRSPVAVVVHVAASGVAGRRAVVEVAEGARVLASTPLALPDETGAVVRLEFVPDLDGFREYTARVRFADAARADDDTSPDPDDVFPDDNVRRFVIDNRRRTWRILYFSGRPNWQQKFVRRALEEEPAFDVASLIRISGPERKFEFRGARTSLANPLFEGSAEEGALAPRWDEAVFLRLGVRQSELAQGYPSTEYELFRYHLVIWGDVERSFFAQRHLALTREFVAERGGSFLVLGGPRALEQGGYAGTVIESLLPVVLPTSGGTPRNDLAFHPEPTFEGFLSGIFALDEDPERSAALLRDLPPLYAPNTFTATRAGATVLARVSAGSEEVDVDSQPFFAWQRFGQGLSAVLATGETWSWELGTGPEQGAHGRFWRQLVRGLVQGVAEPVAFEGGEDLIAGRPDTLTVALRDSLFAPREGLRVDIRASGPGAEDTPLSVIESLEEPGIYRIPVRFGRVGAYRLALTATDTEGHRIASGQAGLAVHPDHRERTAGAYDPQFLRDLSERTGGRFYELDQLDDLVAALPLTTGSEEHIDRIPIWHLPPIYLIAAAFLLLEWMLRRRRGLA